jgi:UDP-N-acetylmuramyl pentapeptide phosphotransferase/UDP-N-acetylglucosamine-1-phosphate transferase
VAFAGALVVLWYNTYPAQVLWAIQESLTIGGIIAFAFLVKELLLPILEYL